MSCCIGAYDSDEVENLQETDPLVDEPAYCESFWCGRKVSIDCIRCQAFSVLGTIGCLVGGGIVVGAGSFMSKLLHSSDTSPLSTVKFIGSGGAICLGAIILCGTVYLLVSQRKHCILVSKSTVANDVITDDLL